MWIYAWPGSLPGEGPGCGGSQGCGLLRALGQVTGSLWSPQGDLWGRGSQEGPWAPRESVRPASPYLGFGGERVSECR